MRENKGPRREVAILPKQASAHFDSHFSLRSVSNRESRSVGGIDRPGNTFLRIGWTTRPNRSAQLCPLDKSTEYMMHRASGIYQPCRLSRPQLCRMGHVMDRVCRSVPSMKTFASTVHSHMPGEHLAEELVQLSKHLVSRGVPKLASKTTYRRLQNRQLKSAG